VIIGGLPLVGNLHARNRDRAEGFRYLAWRKECGAKGPPCVPPARCLSSYSTFSVRIFIRQGRMSFSVRGWQGTFPHGLPFKEWRDAGATGRNWAKNR